MSKYVASSPISQNQDAKEYAYREFIALEEYADLPVLSRMRFEVLYAAPEKPRIGDVVYASGTPDWTTTGEGLYVRTSTGWEKLN